MPNLKSKISKHNFKILKGSNSLESESGCNCRKSMGPCPFNGNCLAESLIHRAEVIDENEYLATYTGLTDIIVTGNHLSTENRNMIPPFLPTSGA